MEELKHFSHKHPLILSKYDDNSPADALCYGCSEPITINTYVYRCSTTPTFNTEQDSSCTRYLLHKSCSTLPPYIQHDHHIQHMFRLRLSDYEFKCNSCKKKCRQHFFYECTSCFFWICFRCSLPERDLNHASHNHTLTLLPLKFSHFCGACGTKGSEDFSCLCKTCLFWIHKSCAFAPPQLICKAHHNDHPLVLEYSLPEVYQYFGVSCSLCRERVNSYLWIYYCADCRYFAHVKCAISATESGEDSNEDVGDAEDADLVHFPISDDKPFLLYQLIQKFAENFSASTDERSAKADKISHCSNGHLLVLFDDFNNKNDAESESSDRMICDGCVQPIQLPPDGPDSFYGCLDCNFFLHTNCAAELPREFQHASHPEHKLIRSDQISKPNAFFTCGVCERLCYGIFYSCDSCSISVDLVCAAMPSEIRHDSHKHKLKYKHGYDNCDGCAFGHSTNYRCETCNYQIHIGCARGAGKIKHRWDEHQLDLMYPPVKGHPHDFNCELCSRDINPNYWFYHCRKCDTSFHAKCLNQGRWGNIKFGAIVKDDTLHQHGLKITPAGAGPKFKCGSCGIVKADTYVGF